MQQPAHPSAKSIPEEPYAVAATPSTARPRRTLKHGDTFILVDSHGDIGVIPDGSDGLFHTDTRFLSRFALTLEGMQPLLLGSNVYDDNSMLTVDMIPTCSSSRSCSTASRARCSACWCPWWSPT